MSIEVDVISDVICPWCYVGKRRLEKAVAALDGQQPVRVRWHPFQLNPQMPKAGMNRKEYRTAKFGSWERSLALDAQATEAGRGEGIRFAFDQIGRTPNTLDAHRLIGLAETTGVQHAVVEGLFRAYFTEGRDISEPTVLLDVVAEAGLERGRAERLLASDDGLGEIEDAEGFARKLGVRGVPFFLVGKTLYLSGSQEPEAFLAAFRKCVLFKRAEGEGVCRLDPSGEGRPSC